MDYYAALGLETPTEEGANEQEVAAPAESGETVQEVAEPAEDTEIEAESDDEVTEDAQPEQTGKVQSKEERAANARRRREQEKEDAIRAAREEAEAQLKAKYNKIIAEAGLVNPLDGKKPVTQIEELEAYNNSRRQRQMEKDLREGKLTPEALSTAVENSEPYRRMKALAEQAEAARQKADSERTELAIKAQMDEIKTIDPTITEVKDFLSMPDYPQFKAYVDRGMTYVEAFRLLRYDNVITTAANKQVQANMAKAAGKEHLTGSRSKGKGAESVPNEVMAMYRMLNPGLTEAEYQAHYNKNLH